MFWLRSTTFEYEKDWNNEKVVKLKMMEKDLVAMSGERDNLRAQVENAERRARGMVFCFF